MSVISASLATQHRGGLDFYALARGTERSYSCSYLINLDPDLLGLCADEDRNALDMARDALISHTNRIFAQIIEKSGKDLNQFCFGTAYVNLNPNYRKLDNMDPITWKKEGISGHWTGKRGYRKSCCKICCTDKSCVGCRKDNGCYNAPIRGCYDGLVVLTAITKESLPNQFTVIPPGASIHDVKSRRARQELDKRLDQEDYAMTLEGLLTAHYQYGGDVNMANKVVTSQRMAIILGETVEFEKRKTRKYPAYAIYVAYRLESEKFRNDEMVGVGKFNRLLGSGPVGKAVTAAAALAAEANKAIADEAVRGISEGSFVAGDVEGLDKNFQLMWEAADRMEDEEDDFADTFRGISGDFSGASGRNGSDEEDNEEKILEQLDDKKLITRIESLEAEHSKLIEKVWKLEHGKTWTENRLDSLQSELNEVKVKVGIPLAEDA